MKTLLYLIIFLLLLSACGSEDVYPSFSEAGTIDTVLLGNDTVFVADTITVLDTAVYKDSYDSTTSEFIKDTIITVDTIVVAGDTLFVIDTLYRYDTTGAVDTILVVDTTVIAKDTVIVKGTGEFYLDLSSEEFDDWSFLEGYKDLKFLDLSRTNFSDKDMIHLRKMDRLQLLNLSETGVTTVSCSRNLKELILSRCKSIVNIDFLINFIRLELIDIQYTPVEDITVLSEIKTLKNIDIYQCDNIAEISISDLPNLETINTIYYRTDKNIKLSNLQKLNNLSIHSGSYNGIAFDTVILNYLPSLCTLSISNSDVVNISGVDDLVKLTLDAANPDFAFLELMPKLEEFNFINRATGSTSPIVIPNNLTALKKLTLEDIDERDFSSINNLINLEYLYIDDIRIETFPSLPNLIKLKELRIYDSYYMTDLSSINLMSSLETIYLEQFNFLKAVPDISNLANLTTFTCRNAQRLNSISGLAGATSISSLTLYNVDSLSDLSGIEYLTSLEELTVAYTKKLNDLGKIALLQNLKTLDISNSSDLEDVTTLAPIRGLETLYITSCYWLDDYTPLVNSFVEGGEMKVNSNSNITYSQITLFEENKVNVTGF
jgi:hypothetical protein